MILGAWGLIDYSPVQMSEVLTSLRLSHSIVGRLRDQRLTYDGLSAEQPVWPVIADSIDAMVKVKTKRSHLVYLVCDSRAALAATNIYRGMWPEYRVDDIIESTKRSLVMALEKGKKWDLVRNELTVLDYVNIAAKPSFLNDLQTLFYKINPYSLRKEVQLSCIGYLGGSLSYTAMRQVMNQSLKLAPIMALMTSEKARRLRTAVLSLNQLTVEQSSRTFDFETFEILYIAKSQAKAALAKK
jgi:hypothetical protein